MLPRPSAQIQPQDTKPPRSKITIPLVLFSLVALGGMVYLQHMQVASTPSLGQTLPSGVSNGARFSGTGASGAGRLGHGQWISCREDNDRKTDWCQLTDQSGTILYKGDFLPVGSSHRVAQSNLVIGKFDAATGWVEGPNESMPVPVVPLQNGTLLVPADDSMDLKARWDRDPSERIRATPPPD